MLRHSFQRFPKFISTKSLSYGDWHIAANQSIIDRYRLEHDCLCQTYHEKFTTALLAVTIWLAPAHLRKGQATGPAEAAETGRRAAPGSS